LVSAGLIAPAQHCGDAKSLAVGSVPISSFVRRLYLFSAEKAETTEKDALNRITERISGAGIEVRRAPQA